MSGQHTDAEGIAQTLATIVTGLQGHINARAEEIAAPRVARARDEADMRAAADQERYRVDQQRAHRIEMELRGRVRVLREQVKEVRDSVGPALELISRAATFRWRLAFLDPAVFADSGEHVTRLGSEIEEMQRLSDQINDTDRRRYLRDRLQPVVSDALADAHAGVEGVGWLPASGREVTTLRIIDAVLNDLLPAPATAPKET